MLDSIAVKSHSNHYEAILGEFPVARGLDKFVRLLGSGVVRCCSFTQCVRGVSVVLGFPGRDVVFQCDGPLREFLFCQLLE